MLALTLTLCPAALHISAPFGLLARASWRSSSLRRSYASAYTWFKKALPVVRKKYPGVIYEFIQEEGELVWIPPHYGHAILNLQPSIGVAETLGAYSVSSHSWEKSKSIKALVDLADGTA